MKIVTVIGARPQFVKAAAVSRAIAQHNAALPDDSGSIHEVIVHTGQHFDANMSDIFFSEMQIPHPHHRLEINSVGHGAMTGRMLEKLEEILLAEEPDFVLVYGDTNSTLAGALAARKLQLRVVHVEAGLRSFNMRMPEEVNRILTDRISDILCCPTQSAVENLRREGYENFSCLIRNTGDVMKDAALFYGGFSAERSRIVETLGLCGKEFALCTVHRAENTDHPERLASILAALDEIAAVTPVILPLHPRTRKIISALGGTHAFRAIDPVGYFDMVELLKHARVVLTDSGGVQKEAFFFEKPCLTLRDETEWVELVESGVNRLVGADKARILAGYREMTQLSRAYDAPLYGTGNAGKEIVDTLVHSFRNDRYATVHA